MKEWMALNMREKILFALLIIVALFTIYSVFIMPAPKPVAKPTSTSATSTSAPAVPSK
jgi:hypothetical protein